MSLVYQSGPATNAVAVTPHDSTNIGSPTRALWIGGAGNISVEMNGVGSAVVFQGIAAGSLLPVSVTRVNSTSTTATQIVALY